LDHINPPSIAATHLESVELLIETIQRLSFASNLDQIITIVRSAARRLTGADGATFVLRSGSECYYADEDAIQPLWKGRLFPASQCISGWVMEHRIPASIPDIFIDERIPIDAYAPTFVRSLTMVPIRAQDPIGAIGNYWAQSHTPTAYELRILQALANSTAVAMENIRILTELEARVLERTEQLEASNRELRAEALLRKQMEAKVFRLSLTDELTGLSNRRGFLMRTEQMLKLVHRMQAHAWLFYIDLDGLKQVNDTLGHEAGDQLLRSAAKVLCESFRESDIVSRIGGDEFLVFAVGSIMPLTEIEQRIQDRIAQHNQSNLDQPALSMSIGVVRCDSSSSSLDSMIHQADVAMYTDKNRKRERTRPALAP
jgi:diguanylate cyclase (GGDEF)-like protein